MFQIFSALLLAVTLCIAAAAEDTTLDTTQPEGTTPAQIIQKFTAKEKEFKNARRRCTYRQSIKMQQLDGDKSVADYEQVADVSLDKNGNKVKNVVFAPQPSLTLSPEDAQDLESRLYWTLSTDELPEYNVTYKGKEQVDDLHTYVFDVAPKQVQEHKRYFQGQIWVDDHDFQIVKMEGKSAPDIYPKKKKQQPNLFPKFTTYRQQMDGKYWYPTYSETDDNLHFPVADVHIKGTVRASNYKCPDSVLASSPQTKSGSQ